MKKKLFVLTFLALSTFKMMAQDRYLGEIRICSFNFPPKGWAMCNGQLLPINQNQALFALLGTTYGGDGRVNFALPDLRGRVPMHVGNGYTQGERAGSESTTINITQLPQHTHGMPANTALIPASSTNGTTNTPVDNYYAVNTTRGNEYSTTANAQSLPYIMAPTAVANNGGSQPHNEMQPYIIVNYIISLQGIFPSQY